MPHVTVIGADGWKRRVPSFITGLLSSFLLVIFHGASHVVLVLLRWCKELVSQGRRCKRHRFDPWVRMIPWRRKWQPTPVFLPGEFHAQRSLAGYSPWESIVGINPATWGSVLCAGFFTRTKPASFGSTPFVSELYLYFSVFLFYNLKVTFLKLSKQFSW